MKERDALIKALELAHDHGNGYWCGFVKPEDVGENFESWLDSMMNAGSPESDNFSSWYFGFLSGNTIALRETANSLAEIGAEHAK